MTNAVSLSGRMLVFTRLNITTDNLDEIVGAVASYGGGDDYAPVVIDSTVTLDLKALKDKLWQHKIAVVGVVAGVLDEQAQALHLVVLPKDKPVTRLKDDSQKSDNAPSGRTTAVHKELVRSGQQIQHLDGDLVLLRNANNGSEVVSGGSLYIYGKASGRIVAGAMGDTTARIFCQEFDPLLVSVAGTYCLRENIADELINKAVMVSFDKQTGLVFEAI